MSLLRTLFEGDEDELFRRYASSLEMDVLLAHEDLAGSLAHVAMLGDTGIISHDDAATIEQGLQQIRRELTSGQWRPDPLQEDIHMAVEARLTELVGAVGGRLHTARSRNDQVATDVRLWLKANLQTLAAAVGELTAALADRVERDGAVLLPGYTHLQRGQPVLLGHHLLAHAFALTRDMVRMQAALRNVDRSPLGACAMAGTPHPIDRRSTAAALGFRDVIENAMDAVAAKDHLQETVAACAICMSTLSRMAEELVLWSSSEFGLVRMADHHTTSSSIMPQKRNPDGAELVRGQAGLVFGHLQALLVLTKGLPLAYNRDTQQERMPVIESILATAAATRLMAAMWRDLEIRADRFEGDLFGDLCLATELADLLAARGVPFREAHQAVAEAVRWCQEQGGNLTLLQGGAARRFHAGFPDDLSEWLDPRAAVERRTSEGGTASAEVQRQLEILRRKLAELTP